MAEPNWDRTPWNAGPGELSSDDDRYEYDDVDDICHECGGEGSCPLCNSESEQFGN